MGKSNAKKVKPCGYQRPHQGHVHDGKWCKGMPGEDKHIHDWDKGQPVMQRLDGKEARLGETGFPWKGPYECRCGMSRWLQDGRAADQRFPNGADPLDRIMALHAKVNAGQELTEEDQAEVQAIADMLMRVLEPLIAELQRLGEVVVKMVQGFLDSLPPETVAHLIELGKGIGEKPDAVDTVSLVDSTGEVVDTLVVTPVPQAALNAISLQEDTAFMDRSFDLQPGYAVVRGRRMDLS